MDTTGADAPAAAEERYADEPTGRGGHAALAGVFTALVAGGIGAAVRSGRGLPERVDLRDVALVGVATHRVSRLVTRDKVSDFARAPFTRYQGRAGHAEIDERPRGRGLRRSVGELLVCPFCFAQWVSAAFTVGLVLAPRPTRLVAAMFASTALADGLHIAYRAGADRA
ncbi:DUF1360 domain-containing protein [Miltoncostaea marina]|uniref:DUF1360 domain-containing protein n=1 Tax=Miltoncostaea marina TaxID=2843215 RepID=UPI001C3E0425|nr:DUF1360 domain-containing protein [Miltoncostaea marina]